METIKKITKLFFVCINIWGCTKAQDTLNLNFDEIDFNTKRPKKIHFSNYKYDLVSDSLITYEGKYSLKIKSNETEISENDFAAATISIPPNFIGEEIELSGYIKTQNVTTGKARLWMRIDGDSGILQFDNMESTGVSGTVDWKKYSIKLKLSNDDKNISFGCLMSGHGQAWFDKLSVKVDGIELNSNELKRKTLETYRATIDKEFDKGSKISIKSLSLLERKNLFLLCRIWGFLKYYHPKVGEGNYNWDYELFRKIPIFLKAQNNNEIDKIVSNWLNDLGNINNCVTCSQGLPLEIAYKHDFDWIEKTNLSKETINKLFFIKHNYSNNKHFYVSKSQSGNPIFKNEGKYEDIKFPDSGYQLLGLIRYWNYIEYFFPYKYLMEKNMTALFYDNLSNFLSSKNILEYQLSTLQLISQINDSHAIILGNVNSIKGNLYSIAKVDYIEKSFVITDFFNDSLSASSNLKIGDIITKIRGENISKIVQQKRKFISASNDNTFHRDLCFDLLRGNDSLLNIEILRNKKLITLDVTLFNQSKIKKYELFTSDFPSKTPYEIIDNNIGYINLEKIKKHQVSDAFKSFKNCKGIIIDNRGYPSDFPIFEIGSFLVEKPVDFAKISMTDINKPGDFFYNFTSSLRQTSKDSFKGKVVILTDVSTQSSAEYHTMAFKKATNAVVIGETTAGADGNVSDVYLPGGIHSRFTGTGIYYANGKETQRIGLIPDIKVERTINAVFSHTDEILKKAVEEIKK